MRQSQVPQHKRMAEGERVGFKKGGAVRHDDTAADRRLVKQMVKGEALTGKKRGGAVKCMKCGGSTCRCK